MTLTVTPRPMQGTVRAIGSKSEAHRALICSALSDGPVSIENIPLSGDVMATVECLRVLGTEIVFNGCQCTVIPGKWKSRTRLDCRESGSTLRFLLPVTSAVVEQASFTGSGRLPERPLAPLIHAMENRGIVFSASRLPVSYHGKLQPGEYTVPGNVSSQLISGLLMALSVVSGTSTVHIISPLQSAPYVEMTVEMLRRFGAVLYETVDGYSVIGKDRLSSPQKIRMQGDWSNSAFFLGAGALGGTVTVEDLSPESTQGDRAILQALADFGAETDCRGNRISVAKNRHDHMQVDLHNTPDLLPILAILAAFGKGKSRFVGGERLRLKESDRLTSTANMIRDLGGHAEEEKDGIAVFGTGLSGGIVRGEGDHRIVMAAAIAGAYATEPVEIRGAEAVMKSYPSFFRDFRQLGGIANGI